MTQMAIDSYIHYRFSFSNFLGLILRKEKSSTASNPVPAMMREATKSNGAEQTLRIDSEYELEKRKWETCANRDINLKRNRRERNKSKLKKATTTATK